MFRLLVNRIIQKNYIRLWLNFGLGLFRLIAQSHQLGLNYENFGVVSGT